MALWKPMDDIYINVATGEWEIKRPIKKNPRGDLMADVIPDAELCEVCAECRAMVILSYYTDDDSCQSELCDICLKKYESYDWISIFKTEPFKTEAPKCDNGQ